MLGKEFIRWKLLAIVEFSKKQYEIAIRARGGNKKTRKKVCPIEKYIFVTFLEEKG